MVRQFIDLINRYVPGGMLLLSSLPIFNTNLWNYTEINPQSIHSDLPARNQTLIVDDISNICAQDALVIPEFAGIVIDDLSQQFSQRGPERYWHAEEQGFENHFWWTHNNRSGTDNLGLWSLGISFTDGVASVSYFFRRSAAFCLWLPARQAPGPARTLSSFAPICRPPADHRLFLAARQ